MMRVLLALLLTACVETRGPNGADARWATRDRPVLVLVSADMGDECLDAVAGAIDMWRGYGVTYLDAYTVVNTSLDVGIEIRRGDLPSSVAGRCRLRPWRGDIYRARIVIGTAPEDCTVQVVGHELGHALGLDHNPDHDRLMRWDNASSIRVDADELEWVR